jgi:uncharacterized protein (DUF1501 family)
MIVNRRSFLRRSLASALGGVALYSTLGNLKVMAAAANLAKGVIPDDYRALVCVFLYGGNDSFNTIAPWNATNPNLDGSRNTFGIYSSARPAMALTQPE